jgi:hypothetical protein
LVRGVSKGGNLAPFREDATGSKNASGKRERVHKVKSVSIKSVNVGGTWQVKNRADVDARLEELRQRLYKEIEDDTVLNIEF